MVSAVSIEPSNPRTVLRQREKSRADIPSESIQEHQLRNEAIPLLDHIAPNCERLFFSFS